MELETIFFAAIQSSFLLGLLHGMNPCGHSWLVLAPFVTMERNGSRVVLLTCAFLGGTVLACLALGASLGTISQLVPKSMGIWVEAGTSVILVSLGLLLIYNPHLLHHHEHDQNEGTTHSHFHKSRSILKKLHHLTKDKKLLPYALFGIGFVNMIVPCPTAAIMYGYALNAGSTLTATLVFGTYAISTAIAVGCVIFIIFKVTGMASSLQKKWVEPLIMRLAGGVIVLFSVYGLYQAFA
ncbi:MAG: sulfite exporter TauE/SafE family protein [Desulfobulbaceae bacterium]|nr:sulfite exporter TauE/SafE family protein [Desulfobulbaceae bacterium]